MQSFNIIKENEIEETYRVSKIKNDFDLQNEHCKLELRGEVDIPNNWNIGVITGGSGTGKSTIAKELFKEKVVIGCTAQKRLSLLPAPAIPAVRR